MNLNRKVIAITGSTGFMGTHLLNELRKYPIEIKEISSSKGIDLTHSNSIEKMGTFDSIVHMAAKSFVPYSFENPLDFYTNNILSTLNVLEAARLNSAKVIFISSYLYGPPNANPVDESHSLNPHNPYAQSKLICENLCEGYHRDFKIPITILRPFNIYGPEQKEPFLIPTILNQAKTGKIVLNDERPKRDYIHVFDIVDAIIKSLVHESKDILKYNLGTGISYSVAEIVNIINDIYEGKLEINYLKKYRQGEVLNTAANIEKAQIELGWTPNVSIYSGLRGLIKS